MPTTLKVNNRSTIHFGRAARLLPQLTGGRRCMTVTDDEVLRCQPALFGDSRPMTVGRGEESKTLGSIAGLYRELMARGADRTSFIIGIGGGIVTDMAGFAAAT